MRFALGGTTENGLEMIVRPSLRFIGIGLAVALVLSQATSRLLGALLYDVFPTDPLTYMIVCSVFGSVGVLSAVPAGRRVSRVDPVIALRAD